MEARRAVPLPLCSAAGRPQPLARVTRRLADRAARRAAVLRQILCGGPAAGAPLQQRAPSAPQLAAGGAGARQAPGGPAAPEPRRAGRTRSPQPPQALAPPQAPPDAAALCSGAVAGAAAAAAAAALGGSWSQLSARLALLSQPVRERRLQMACLGGLCRVCRLLGAGSLQRSSRGEVRMGEA